MLAGGAFHCHLCCGVKPLLQLAAMECQCMICEACISQHVTRCLQKLTDVVSSQVGGSSRHKSAAAGGLKEQMLWSVGGACWSVPEFRLEALATSLRSTLPAAAVLRSSIARDLSCVCQCMPAMPAVSTGNMWSPSVATWALQALRALLSCTRPVFQGKTPPPLPHTQLASAVGECPHSFAKGQLVWYTHPDGRCVPATVVHIDVSIQPPSYGVQLGEDTGSYRETEAKRCTDNAASLVLHLRLKQRIAQSPHE